MSHKAQDVDMKNQTYHFFNGIISIEIFDPNNDKMDEKSHKNISIYYIGYVMIKDSKNIKVYSVNRLYLIFRNAIGYFEEINKSKYLMLNPTNKSK